MTTQELFEKALLLKNTLQAFATQDELTTGDYAALRKLLLEHPLSKPHMPAVVKQCRTSSDFWQFIKPKFATYAERREFLRSEFGSLFDALEFATNSPSDNSVLAIMSKVDGTTVHDAWEKALTRRTTDPEGAVTMARTLLETVCKHILDESNETYDDSADLPKLYKLAASRMNLAPSQHTEDVLKQILGGCTAVVEGLGALRNRLSDAHGKGKKGAKPLPIHAELAVNLAGAMATFLLSTWELRQTKMQSNAQPVAQV